METSPYEQLPRVGKIRLMTLLPGEYIAPIRSHLQVVSLDSAPSYEALSYTWGSPFSLVEDQVHASPLVPAEDEVPSMETHALDSSGLDSVVIPTKFLSLIHLTFGQEPWWASGNIKPVGDLDRENAQYWAPHFWASQPVPKLDDGVIPRELFLKGHIVVDSTKVKVRQNLEHALRHLRLRDLERILWIDGICINQNDVVERSDQVSQMGRIFQVAAKVVVWLGIAWENSDAALNFVRDLWQAQLEKNAPSKQSEWKLFKSNFTLDGYLPKERFGQLRALSYLVNRAWFYRRWVVQEVAFAACLTVQCGMSTVSWEAFTNAVEFLNKNFSKLERSMFTYHVHWPEAPQRRKLTPTYCHTPDVQARAASQFLFITSKCLVKDDKNEVRSYLVDISELVTRLRDLRVTDHRDAVFALVSLARDASNARLYPDYSKSTNDVLVDLFQYVATLKKSLDLLIQPWVPAGFDQLLELPTWIRKNDGTKLLGAGFHDDTLKESTTSQSSSLVGYCAGGQFSSSVVINPHDFLSRILRVTGVIVSSVELVTKPAQHGIVPISWSSVGLLDQLWRVIIAGRTKMGGVSPAQYDKLCHLIFDAFCTDSSNRSIDDEWSFDNWKLDRSKRIDPMNNMNLTHLIDVLNGAAHDDSLLPKECLAQIPQNEHIIPFLERMRDCVSNRVLFRTLDHRLGLGPVGTQNGDLVCVLTGCSLPVILRPMGDDYAVIGETYVHGISDGEVMQDLTDGTYVLKGFSLI